MKTIYNSLVSDATAPAELVFQRAKAIEAGVLETFGDSNGLPDKAYRDRMRTLCFNLKDKKNPDLRRAVIEGDIDAAKLVTMSQQVRFASPDPPCPPAIDAAAGYDAVSETS